MPAPYFSSSHLYLVFFFFSFLLQRLFSSSLLSFLSFFSYQISVVVTVAAAIEASASTAPSFYAPKSNRSKQDGVLGKKGGLHFPGRKRPFVSQPDSLWR